MGEGHGTSRARLRSRCPAAVPLRTLPASNEVDRNLYPPCLVRNHQLKAPVLSNWITRRTSESETDQSGSRSIVCTGAGGLYQKRFVIHNGTTRVTGLIARYTTKDPKAELKFFTESTDA